MARGHSPDEKRMRRLPALRLIAGPLKAPKLRYPRPLRKITRSLCSPTAWILRLQVTSEAAFQAGPVLTLQLRPPSRSRGREGLLVHVLDSESELQVPASDHLTWALSLAPFMARPAMSVHTISLTGTAATITLAQAGGERWPKQARQIKTSGPGPATAGESEARPAAAAAPRARAGGLLRRRLGLGMGLIITRIVALSGRVPNSRVSRIAAGGPPARNFAGELDATT